MLEPLKKALLTLLGSVALRPEEIRQVIEELVAEGDLTAEQGKKLFESLVRPARKDGEDLAERWGRELNRLSGLMPLVSRADFRKLCDRVRLLEERLGIQPTAPDEVPGRGDRPTGEV